MRYAIMVSLGVLWTLPSWGCAWATNDRLAHGAWNARTTGHPARDETRVLLVVANRGDETVGLYVLRAGHLPVFVGIAEPRTSAAFDASAAAPRGSRVRFAALARRGGDHLVTDEVSILRSGTVVLEIEPGGPFTGRPDSRRVRPRSA